MHILAVSTHPDDLETLGGGTLARFVISGQLDQFQKYGVSPPGFGDILQRLT